MSLHFPIQVNGLSIGNVNIRRLHKLTPDQISDYEYEVVLYGSLPVHRESWKGNVRHYYGDGALVLIRKVMEDIKPPARSSAD